MESPGTNSTTCPDFAGLGFLPALKSQKACPDFFSGSYFLQRSERNKKKKLKYEF